MPRCRRRGPCSTVSIATALALGAAAAGARYRRASASGNQQRPSPSLRFDFVPRRDPGRQQIGPAGPLAEGSGLTLLEMGAPSLDADRLVASAASNGGPLR